MQDKVWETIINKTGDFNIQRGLTSFINPYSMLMLNDESIASEIDYWYVDGISLVNKINGFKKEKIKRYSFDETSIAPIVFKYAEANGLKLAIIGTKEIFLNKAVDNIQRKFGVNVTYSRNGYFENADEIKQCISMINKSDIDMVVCGMGTPYQERFLIELKRSGWNGYGFTCGGYLHQISKKDDYYPPFFDKFNIRWVYRIYDEPKLLKRYALSYSKFFIKFYFFKKKMIKKG